MWVDRYVIRANLLHAHSQPTGGAASKAKRLPRPSNATLHAAIEGLT